jgi:hypothetical protein
MALGSYGKKAISHIQEHGNGWRCEKLHVRYYNADKQGLL